MLVIGVFGREVRFKPINKVDAGTGVTIVWPANFLETWARAQSRDNQTSASSKVGKRFVIGVSRIFSNVAAASMNRRSQSIPLIPVTHTLHLLSISFRLDPSVTTRYRP